MRDVGAGIRVEMMEVFDGWHNRAMSRIIAFEFVGHQLARLTAVPSIAFSWWLA